MLATLKAPDAKQAIEYAKNRWPNAKAWKIESHVTDYPVCPYCGHVDKDPSEIEFSSSEVAEVTCGECDMDYTLIQHIKTTFTSKP